VSLLGVLSTVDDPGEVPSLPDGALYNPREPSKLDWFDFSILDERDVDGCGDMECRLLVLFS
jgi:hypothetical protein